MKKYFHFLINAETLRSNHELDNQRIRFGYTIAIIHFVFITLIFSLLLYLYGFRVGAKLVLFSTIIPIVSEGGRAWFASTVLTEIINRECKTMVAVKNESDGKDLAYWQKMIGISNKMGVKFNILFDYDQAIEYLQKKESTLQV